MCCRAVTELDTSIDNCISAVKYSYAARGGAIVPQGVSREGYGSLLRARAGIRASRPDMLVRRSGCARPRGDGGPGSRGRHRARRPEDGCRRDHLRHRLHPHLHQRESRVGTPRHRLDRRRRPDHWPRRRDRKHHAGGTPGRHHAQRDHRLDRPWWQARQVRPGRSWRSRHRRLRSGVRRWRFRARARHRRGRRRRNPLRGAGP